MNPGAYQNAPGYFYAERRKAVKDILVKVMEAIITVVRFIAETIAKAKKAFA